MDEPLKPPSQQPRRYFDIVPSKHALPPATSRPIVTNKTDNLADPMVVVASNSPELKTHYEPKYIVAKDSFIDEPRKEERAEPLIKNNESFSGSEAMMAQEYQEVEHELPAGQAVVAPGSSIRPIASARSVGMMEQEYKEVEHELPSGEDLDEDRLFQSVNLSSPEEANSRVSIKRRHNSPQKKYIWAVVAIVVLIIAADLLLDSGVLKAGHSLPHTHFWH